VSLSGEALSIVHQKLFAKNQELILGHLLKLEKKEYFEECGEELTEMEKTAVEEEGTSLTLENLKKFIQQ